jgi:hypothetical protein
MLHLAVCSISKICFVLFFGWGLGVEEQECINERTLTKHVKIGLEPHC